MLACRGDRPALVLVIERPGAGAAIRVSPYLRRGRDVAPYHTEVAAGAVLQLGDARAAVPGVPLWEVLAVRGQIEVVAAPADVRAPCGAWVDGGEARGGGGGPCARCARRRRTSSRSVPWCPTSPA
ncbi:MAG: hypothetical protein H6708_04430 [Kofleriaceae bacterium]|nr:hypothetical protein [Kofleriaceae bacterium]